MSGFSLGKAEGEIGLRYTGGPAAARAKADVDGVGKAAKGNSEHIDRIGTKAGLAGLAIAAGFGIAVKAAVSFEARLSGIAAVTGATGQEMDKVRQLALKLGKDTKFSADEAAVAIEELAKAGVSLPDILNGAAQATVALAAAGEIDLPRAAEIAANAMNVFSLKAKDLPRVADLIAGAANASAIDVEQFAQSLQQSGAAAALAGIGFEDLTAAIALMGNAGIKGSDAGTSLKTMLLNLNPETAKQTALMKKLGIITKEGANQFFDARGKAKGLGDISQVLQNALKGQTKQQQLATLSVLFGSDAIRAAAIMAKAGSKGFDQMSASIGKVKAADVAAKRMDNLKGSLEQMKGSLETAGIAVGTIFLPMLRKVIDAVTTLLNRFLSLTPEMQANVVQVILAAGAFLLVFGAILKVISILSKLRAALLVTFVSSPIGLILAVVIALAAAIFILYQRFKPVRDVVDAVGRALKQAFEGNQTAIKVVLGIILALISPLAAVAAGVFLLYTRFQAVRDGVRRAGEAFREVFGFLVETFGPLFTQLANTVREFVNNIITYFRQIQPQLSTIINAIAALFGAVFPKILAVARVVFGVLIPFIMGALQRLAVGISLILSGIANIFRGIFNIIGGIWKVFLSLITGQWGQAWEGIKQIVRGALQIVLGIIQQVLGVLCLASVGGAISAIIGIFAVGWGKVKGATSSAFGFIKGVVSGGMNAVRGAVSSGMNGAKSASSSGWSVIRSQAATSVNQVLRAVQGLARLGAMVGGFFRGAAAAAAQQIGVLLGHVRSIPGKVASGIGDLSGVLLNAGKQLVQGLIDGIKSMAADAVGAVGGILGKVGGMLPGSPVKEGPLRVLNRGRAGREIIKMVITGIESQRNDLAAALRSVTAPVPNIILGTSAGLVDSAARTAAVGGFGNVTAAFPGGLGELLQDAIENGMSNAEIVVGGDGLARLVLGQMTPQLVKGARR